MGNVKRALILGPAPSSPLDRLKNYICFEKDFIKATDLTDFTTTGDGSEVITIDNTAVGGWLAVAPIAGTNNTDNYAIMPTNLKFQAGMPVYFGARVKLTEAATSAANIIIGLSSTGGADTLIDDGGGPPANYDGAVFFKIDGDLNWGTETSHTTTQATGFEPAAFVSGTIYELGIQWDGVGSVVFSVNGVVVQTHTGSSLPTAAMGVLFGTKNGSANIETLLVDWFILESSRLTVSADSIN